MIFILGTLGKEQETFARLSGMGCIAMGNILRLLVANVGREVFLIKRTIAEPEVFLGEDQSPGRLRSAVRSEV